MRDISHFKNWVKGRYPFLANEQIEDMASHVQLLWVEGKRLETRYEYLAIDYLRKFGKRIGQKARVAKDGKARDVYQNVLLHLDEIVGDQAGWDIQGIVYEKGISGNERIPEVFLKNLKNIDRAIIILTYVWGLTMLEIGEVFGLSESRISQMHTVAIKQIKKGVAAHEHKKRNK